MSFFDELMARIQSQKAMDFSSTPLQLPPTTKEMDFTNDPRVNAPADWHNQWMAMAEAQTLKGKGDVNSIDLNVPPPQDDAQPLPWRAPELSQGFGGPMYGKPNPATPVNTIDLNAPPAPTEADRLPEPNVPGMNQGLPIPEADMSGDLVANLIKNKGSFTQAKISDGATPVKPSSRLRAETTGASKPGESEDKYGDQLSQMLLGREQTATGERDAAKAKAEAAKEMSTEEKVIMSLISALPAVIGGIAGGAINGGVGAAQGIAGGLEGSGKGVNMLNEARAGRIAEAKGEAAKAQERIDQVGNQQLVHAEHKGDQKFATTQTDKQIAAAAKQGAAQRSASLRELLIHEKGAMDRVREQNAQEYEKAKLTAGLKGIKIEDADKAFYVNAHSAVRDVEELKKAINKAGNVEIAYIGDPKVRAILKGRALDLAIAYAKIVDPGSAAKEGEVETAMKLGFPMGLLEGNETSVAALDNILQMIREKGGARADLGLPVPPSLNTPAAQQGDWKQTPGLTWNMTAQ